MFIIFKDYEPVQYLLPTNRIVRNVPFDPDSKTPPPLCVVYSLINLTKFIMEFRSGSFIINIFNSVYSRVDSVNQSVYILELTPNKPSMTIEGLSIFCKVTTQWEDSVSSIRYGVKFNLKGKTFICVYIIINYFIRESISTILMFISFNRTSKQQIIPIHNMLNY